MNSWNNDFNDFVYKQNNPYAITKPNAFSSLTSGQQTGKNAGAMGGQRFLTPLIIGLSALAGLTGTITNGVMAQKSIDAQNAALAEQKRQAQFAEEMATKNLQMQEDRLAKQDAQNAANADAVSNSFDAVFGKKKQNPQKVFVGDVL